jgi:hypothetical protein
VVNLIPEKWHWNCKLLIIEPYQYIKQIVFHQDNDGWKKKRMTQQITGGCIFINPTRFH